MYPPKVPVLACVLESCRLLVAALMVALPAAAHAQSPTHSYKIAEGTAFYISHDGYLLTANHVISHCGSDISAHNEEMAVKARVLATNPEYDLALLKIIPKLSIEHIAYLRSMQQPLRVGEKVVIAGYPDNTTDLSKVFVAFATNDAKITNTSGPNGKDNWMQYSYSARPGFSGGPVLDAYGNIIGVTSGGTCVSRNCIDNFQAALNRLKSATTPEEVKSADEAVATYSDTNIAANEMAIKRFLATSRIAMEERDSVQLPSQERLQEIAESIVNLRCNQSDEDFRHTARVLKIY